jgi:hypothetical protein
MLVELLVMIAILVILIAILVPPLNRAREAGGRAVCTGPMRQIQIAWRACAVDHGDCIVNGQVGPGPDTQAAYRNYGRPWLCAYNNLGPSREAAEHAMRSGALAPYVGDVRVYRCPSRCRRLKAQGTEWLSFHYVLREGSLGAIVTGERCHDR